MRGHFFAGCRIELVRDEGDILVIRDVGPWHIHPTVTNAVELVVSGLRETRRLTASTRLFYFDSSDELAEIKHDGARFTGFAPVAESDMHLIREDRVHRKGPQQ